ncbi:hypothetical protein [Ruminococcus sp. HUN007]|uniref:hypothetical protein n=1 Tax=Ruminococcus sp. HUN007 TaxID=1514668 RepID=UPI0005D18C51|nr:hypothetical protein [Ruminococcus sp. HUN007]
MAKSKLLSISVLCILFLSSCSRSTNDVPESIEISVNEHTFQSAITDEQKTETDPELFPDHLSDVENEYITADAEITMPSDYDKDTVLNTYHSIYMDWDSEKIIADLTENGLITSRSVTDRKVYDPHEKIAGTERVKYQLDDGSEIVFQSGEITFTSPENKTASLDNDIRKYITDENRISTDAADDQKITDALAASDAIMDAAGISEKVLSPDVYSINDIKTENNDENSENETRESSSEKETYLIVYPVVHGGLPSSGITENKEDEVLDCSMVYCIYSDDKITWFKINGIIRSSSVAEEAQILSPVHAFNTLRRSYEDTHKCSITSIDLVTVNRIVYKSDSVSITTEPVWMLSGAYTEAKYSGQNIVTYVSAVSGEVIPVYQITE